MSLDIPSCGVCFTRSSKLDRCSFTACNGKILCLPCKRSLKENKCPYCRSLLDGHIVTGNLSLTLAENIKKGSYKCENRECKEIVTYKDYEKHYEICDHRIEECDKANCPGHKKGEECPFALIVCSDCNTVILKKKKEEHDEICGMKKDECFYPGCQFQDIRKVVIAHVEICPYRVVDCPYEEQGCSYESAYCKMPEHMKECKFFIHPCPCGITCKREEIETHKSICPLTLVDCPYGCGKIERLRMENHKDECFYVPIPCPLEFKECQGCLKHETGKHYKTCNGAYSLCSTCLTHYLNKDKHVCPPMSEGIKRKFADLEFKIGYYVDAFDRNGDCFAGRIVSLSAEGFKVSFFGWYNNFDEVFPYGSNKVLPYRTITRYTLQEGDIFRKDLIGWQVLYRDRFNIKCKKVYGEENAEFKLSDLSVHNLLLPDILSPGSFICYTDNYIYKVIENDGRSLTCSGRDDMRIRINIDGHFKLF